MKQSWALQKQDSVCSEYNEQIYLCPVKKKINLSEVSNHQKAN